MNYINRITFIMLLTSIIVACSQSDDDSIRDNENIQKQFTDKFNAFHNEYYKNNNIKSVTGTFVSSPSIQNIYHYNDLGDLHKIEVVDLNDLDYTNVIEYELLYNNDNRLEKRRYENVLLTESVYEYQNGLITKISDFRNDELFYSTDFNYSDNSFLNTSVFKCFNSSGLGFGVSCSDETISIYEYDSGNLVRVNQAMLEEPTVLIKYENPLDNNLPSSVVQFNNEELTLTYQYFN